MRIQKRMEAWICSFEGTFEEKIPRKGRLYALTCVERNYDTAMGAAIHLFSNRMDVNDVPTAQLQNAPSQP